MLPFSLTNSAISPSKVSLLPKIQVFFVENVPVHTPIIWPAISTTFAYILPPHFIHIVRYVTFLAEGYEVFPFLLVLTPLLQRPTDCPLIILEATLLATEIT